MSIWQPMETAPQDGDCFIAYDGVTGKLLFTMYWDGEDYITENESWSGDFTHWMPLPKPPKELI